MTWGVSYYDNTAAAITITSNGSPGDVLTSNGTSAPTFQAPSGGGSLTPIFVAYATTNQTGVTGAGTFYQVHFDATDRNDSSAFDTSTFLFTAPKSGAYLFVCNMALSNLVAANLFQATFLLNGSVQNGNPYVKPFAISNSTQYNVVMTQIILMSTSDTMQVNVAGSGNGTDNIDILGNGSAGAPGNTTFCGTFLG